MGAVETLLERLHRLKAYHHRLRPDRRLVTLEDAKAFVDEVGIATLTPGNELPSVFGAVRGGPHELGSRGFGSWPREQWWWGGALAESQDILRVKILSGKGLFVAKRLWPPLDSIIRKVMSRLDEAAVGPWSLSPEARHVLDYLQSHGPTRTDVLRRELGLETPTQGRRFHRAKGQLESLGVLVGQQAEGLESHIHLSILSLWDQRFPKPTAAPRHGRTREAYWQGLTDFLLAAVGAAVVVEEKVSVRWFVWSRDHQAKVMEALVDSGQLHRIPHGEGDLLATAEWIARAD